MKSIAFKQTSESLIKKCVICTHCGKEFQTNSIRESNENFCCSGCKTVYYLLTKDQLKNKPESKKAEIIDDLGENYSYLNLQSFKDIYTSPDNPNSMKFYIEGVHCTSCLMIIERIAEIVEGIENVSLNMSDNIATVLYSDSCDFSSFPNEVKKYGYKAIPLQKENISEELKKSENKKQLYKIGVAGVAAGNIMLLSAAIYSGAEGMFARYFEYIIFLLTIPVITYCSYGFYKNCFSSVKMGIATVDIPIVFVITAGFILSTYNLYNSGEIYFDSITTFIFLILISRYVLKTLQDKLGKNKKLTKFLYNNNKVYKWNQNTGQYVLHPSEHINKGDKIRIEKGRSVPADGKLLTKSVTVNLSVISGESIPKIIFKGDNIYAGTVVDEEALIEVSETGYATRIGKILKDIEERSLSKNSYSSFADKYSTFFTLSVALLSIAFFAIFTFSYGTSEALRRIISFILVSCPCAFVFALPLTYAFSIKSALSMGFVIKDTNLFYKMRNIKNFYFDKTGTLTKGIFKILSWEIDDLSNEDLTSILAIQKTSGHPIGRAIVNKLADFSLNNINIIETKPLYSKGYMGITKYGTYEFITTKADDYKNDFNHLILNKTTIYKNKTKISEILFGDTIREDAKFLAEKLVNEGQNVFIVSGDKKENVLKVGHSLSIPEENCFYGLTPEDKIKILQNNKNSVMVGDGLNDAGALSTADLGIAIEGGVKESLEASDVYLLSNKLSSIYDLVKYNEQTSRTLKISTAFSIIYNLVAGTFSLLGFIDPLIAAVLMPLSSLSLIAISYIGQIRPNGGVN